MQTQFETNPQIQSLRSIRRSSADARESAVSRNTTTDSASHATSENIRPTSADVLESALSFPGKTDSVLKPTAKDSTIIGASTEDDTEEIYESAVASVSLHTPQLSPVANTSEMVQVTSAEEPDSEVKISNENIREILDSVPEKVNEPKLGLTKENINSLTENISAFFASSKSFNPLQYCQ